MAVIADGVDREAPSVRAVTRWQAAHQRGPGAGQRAEQVYVAALVIAIFGALVYGTVRSALAEVLSSGGFGRWGPSVVLLALLAAARTGIVQGPVVFSQPDVSHLLGAPLPRSGLVARPLRRALGFGAGAGAVIGGVLLVGLTDAAAPPQGASLAALVVGCALAGVLAVLAAWAVSASAAVERAVRLATWPLVVVAAALAVIASTGHAGTLVAQWSGPWGWALAAGAGASNGRWAVTLGLLAALVVVVAAVVWRRRERGATERFLRRAEGRDRLTASLMDFDARTARQGLESVSWQSRGRRETSLPRVRRLATRRGATAAIVWRDLLAAAESPGVVVQALACAAAGAVLTLLDAQHVVATLAGAALIYVGGARAIEPLRMELDAPRRTSVLLGLTAGRATRAHAIVPLVGLTVVGALAAAGVALGGGLPPAAAAAALLVVLAAPTVGACAALSARRRGRMPREILLAASVSDPSGGGLVVLGWLVLWPAAAAAAVALPMHVLQHGAGHPAGSALALAGAALVIALVALVSASRRPVEQ